MTYRRVLYTNKLTEQLKLRLRIMSCDKRRAYKGNVYFVYFASDADMQYADQAAKWLRHVTLKPFQRSDYESKREQRISVSKNQVAFSSPTNTHSSIPDCVSTCITSQRSPLRRVDETLDQRVMRVFGPCVPSYQAVTPIIDPQPPNSVSFSVDENLVKNSVTANEHNKKQLIGNVHLCLSAMETARRAVDELGQLHGKIFTDYN
jgi:hypothetical protein